MVTLAQAGYLNAANLRPRQGRDIDIEQRGIRQRLGQEPGHDIAGNVSRGVQMGVATLHQRKGNGGHAQQMAFGSGRHGAGINRVVAHIGAVIDARDDNIRALIEQAGHRDVNAVGWRAIDIEKATVGLAHRKRAIKGQGVGRTTAVPLRGNHGNRSELTEHPGERGDPR